MNKIEQLAREATDLARYNSDQGHIELTSSPTAGWRITVYVSNEFAFHHCDKRLHNGINDFGVIVINGDDLDTVLDSALVRVANAVADTPCEQVPA